MLQTRITVAFVLLGFFASAQDWTKKMNEPNANFYDIQKSFKKYWKKEERKEKLKKFFMSAKPTEEENEGYILYKRWEQFVEPRVYPSGDLSVLNEGEKEFTKLITNPSYRSMMQAGGNWQPLGATVVPSNGGGAGRLNCIRFDPSNSNFIYAGAPAGGLWKSTNAGTSWTTTTDLLPSLGVNDVAVHPTNPNVIYIATGDDDGGDTYSVGVLKSTDGGVTWNMTGLNYTVNLTRKISRILIHPTNPNILFAGTSSGLYRSLNAGVTWFRVIGASPIKDVEFKPGDPTTVYAVSSKNFFRSTNGGSSFVQINTSGGMPNTALVGRFAIAVTPAAPNFVYVVATNASDNGYLGVYQSQNSGINFTQNSNTPNLMGWDENGMDSGGQGWYTLAIAASPINPNEIVVGGVNVWRSDDAGMNWMCVAHWWGAGGVPYVHADIHDLIYRADGSLYAASDGGIFRLNNSAFYWDDLSDGLQIGQMYRLGCSATNANVTVQGWQDNGTNMQNTTLWSRIIGGDGMECFIDWSNPSYVYGEYQNGEIQRSSNGGASFTSIKNNITEDGTWITPWCQDPQSSQTLYAGYKNVWKSTNRGTTWTQISTFNSGGLTSLAVAPSNPQYIYASTGGTVYKTTNGGASWTTITPAAAGGSLTYIAVHTTNPDIVWVTRSGYSAGNKVYKTTDGGASWVNMSYDLPNIPANCIVHQNGTNDGVYVGTDLGVFYTDNTLTQWMGYNNGLPNVIIDELEIHYGSNKLRAATYGRGLWETAIYNPSSLVPFANFKGDTLAGCPGFAVTYTDMSTNSPTAWSWTFPGGTPATSTLQNPTIVYNTPGTYNDVKLVVSNVNGTDSIVKHSYIAVSPQITPEISLNNNDTLCSGQSVQLLSSFGYLYKWHPTNQTSPQINVTTTGTYSVTVTDVFGCAVTSAPVDIYVFPSPSTPTITMSNDTLFASNAYSYQWNINGSAVSGATDSFFVITQPGAVYTVTVGDSIGFCSATSANFVGFEEFTNYGFNYSVYPNPATDIIHLQLQAVVNNPLRIEITDVLGKLIYSNNSIASIGYQDLLIDLSSYKKGFYFLTIKNNFGSSTKKVVKE